MEEEGLVHMINIKGSQEDDIILSAIWSSVKLLMGRRSTNIATKYVIVEGN